MTVIESITFNVENNKTISLSSLQFMSKHVWPLLSLCWYFLYFTCIQFITGVRADSFSFILWHVPRKWCWQKSHWYQRRQIFWNQPCWMSSSVTSQRWLQFITSHQAHLWKVVLLQEGLHYLPELNLHQVWSLKCLYCHTHQGHHLGGTVAEW